MKLSDDYPDFIHKLDRVKRDLTKYRFIAVNNLQLAYK
jgi:hypothetical protein